MKNPFMALFRARDKPKDAVSGAPSFFFGTSGSGKNVTAQSAIQLSTVYACVRVISETIASLPLGVYEQDENGNRKDTEHAGDRPDGHAWLFESAGMEFQPGKGKGRAETALYR